MREQVKIVHVPFDGSAPARTALQGGHVTVAVTTISEVLQLYQAKFVKVLYLEDTKRHWLYPDVPTIAEAGYPNPKIIYDWRALGAPKGVPADRMKVLTDGFKKCFDDPEFQKLAYDLGLATVYMDAKATRKVLGRHGIVPSARPGERGSVKRKVIPVCAARRKGLPRPPSHICRQFRKARP